MKKLLTAFAAIVCMSSVALASEVESLVNKLAEKGVISYGEAAQLVTESNEDARASLASASVSTLPAWIQNITMSGDLRLRSQDDWNAAKNFIRIRDRVRVRLNFETRLAEGYKAGFGISNGSELVDASGDELNTNIIDANSGSANSTFTGFGRLPVELNLAYIEYSPVIPGVSAAITVGKMKQGVQVWNATDLLWESSLNPDGAAVGVNYNLNNEMTLGFIGSILTINNLNSAVSNPTASVGEITYTWDKEDFKVKLGVAQQKP